MNISTFYLVKTENSEDFFPLRNGSQWNINQLLSILSPVFQQIFSLPAIYFALAEVSVVPVGDSS